MHGVILAGGTGSRLKAFTNVLNKGLAPIYTPLGATPQLLFPLKTLVSSGINDILIITSRDHCGKIVELIGDGEEYNCNITYKIQNMQAKVTGIAQALKLAEHFVKDDKFAVILGDNYYEDSFKNEFYNFYHSESECMLFLKEVSDPHRFGVAEIENNTIKNIIEKPKKPISNLAVTGLYLYSPSVFDELYKLKPSARMEIEITDINNHYIDKNKISYSMLNGYWRDMGTNISAKEVIDFIWSKDA